MSDAIDRQAAIDAIDSLYFDTIEDHDRTKERIKRLPTIQTEIIRCKDCKHYVAHSLFGRSHGWCERLCDEFDKSLARGTEPDDYCSRAEGREDG